MKCIKVTTNGERVFAMASNGTERQTNDWEDIVQCLRLRKQGGALLILDSVISGMLDEYRLG